MLQPDKYERKTQISRMKLDILAADDIGHLHHRGRRLIIHTCWFVSILTEHQSEEGGRETAGLSFLF